MLKNYKEQNNINRGKSRLDPFPCKISRGRLDRHFTGQEMWKDIDRKRQAIVHKEETPEISHEDLLRAINYLQRTMMGISINAQVDKGVPLEWGTMGDFIRKKNEPTIKAKLSNQADSGNG